MARLVVQHDVLQESAAVTAGVAQDMHDARTALGRRADGLLGSGWSGPAASAFRSAMSEWDTGAGEVMDALHRLGDLIATADRGFAATDTATSGVVQTAGSGLGAAEAAVTAVGAAVGQASSGSGRFASGLNM